jgi:acyl-CoA-dependent ceramide synthase
VWSNSVQVMTQMKCSQYLHRNLPTEVLNPTELWRHYPHIPLAGPLKFYYLTQTAFYLHQLLILNAEARRKDHVQMMTHHVITVGLMACSYFLHFTRVGCLIMVLMDWCDIFLPVSAPHTLARQGILVSPVYLKLTARQNVPLPFTFYTM